MTASAIIDGRTVYADGTELWTTTLGPLKAGAFLLALHDADNRHPWEHLEHMAGVYADAFTRYATSRREAREIAARFRQAQRVFAHRASVRVRGDERRGRAVAKWDARRRTVAR